MQITECRLAKATMAAVCGQIVRTPTKEKAMERSEDAGDWQL